VARLVGGPVVHHSLLSSKLIMYWTVVEGLLDLFTSAVYFGLRLCLSGNGCIRGDLCGWK